MYLALVLTLALQTLATMAAFSIPAIAPAVAADLSIDANLVGIFVSIVYGFGIFSALFSPGYIRRYGAVRVSQYTGLSVIAMLLAASVAGPLGLAAAALLLGIGYGTTAPLGTHLLVPRTPPARHNLVLSIRQIGVPLGGVAAALILPWLTTLTDWRIALLVMAPPMALILIALEFVRRDWDKDREPRRPLFEAGVFGAFEILRQRPAVRDLSITCFIYAGVQLCFVSFLVVQLTLKVGLDLIVAGQVLALYQICGVVSRPIWGWLADRWMRADLMLGLHGLIIVVVAVAAGQFDASWPLWSIALVCMTAGATASGFTGVAYGEFARLGGHQRIEATAVGSAAMFSGVLTLPALFSVVVTLSGNYALAYVGLAILAASGAWLMIKLYRQ